MYFRKYFEGTISNSNSYGNIYINGASTTVRAYINQTDVINAAIAETLSAAGIESTYGGTADKCILQIAGIPVQFIAVSNMGNPSLYVKGKTSFIYSTTTSYSVFSGTSYKFYVSLVGDPKGILTVYLGYYSGPAALGTGIMIARITDLRDGSKKLGISGAASQSIYIYDEAGEKLPEIETVAFTNLLNNQALTQSGALIPLIEAIDSTGFFRIDQCYKGHAALTANNFYNIGGDIFMQLGGYYLVKCTTEILH